MEISVVNWSASQRASSIMKIYLLTEADVLVVLLVPQLDVFQSSRENLKGCFSNLLQTGSRSSCLPGRVQLVKSIIQGMLLYSFQIYLWSSSLVKQLDSWIRNFIWFGDISKRKLITVSWQKLCSPFQVGGLGTR